MIRSVAVVATICFATAALGAPCMFNPKKGQYQKCHHASMGKCHHYSSSCEPAGKCMFNPKKGQYQKCHHASMGKCHHYGSSCEPR